MRRLSWAHVFVAVVVVAGLGGWIYGKAVELIEGRRAGELPVVQPLPEPLRERPEDPGGYTPDHLDARVLEQPRDARPPEGEAPEEEAPEAEAPPPAPAPESPAPRGEDAPDGRDAPGGAGEAAPMGAPPAAEAAGEGGEGGQESAPPEPPRRRGGPPARPADVSEEEPEAPEEAVADAVSLQLASFLSEGAAEREWARLRRAHPDVLGAFRGRVREIDRGGGQVLYQLRAGPFAGRESAEAACDALKAAGEDCFVAGWP